MMFSHPLIDCYLFWTNAVWMVQVDLHNLKIERGYQFDRHACSIDVVKQTTKDAIVTVSVVL